MLYQYQCKTCSKVVELMVPLKNYKKPCKENCPVCNTQTLEKIFSAPTFIDPVRLGVKKPDKGFQEVLAKINERNPKGNAQSRFV